MIDANLSAVDKIYANYCIEPRQCPFLMQRYVPPAQPRFAQNLGVDPCRSAG
jgi:Fis family transcriptional regulator, factor for inversion stimulation protein